VTRALILPALLCAALTAIPAARAQPPDPDALRRGFHQDRMDSQIQDLERRSLGGKLDSGQRRDLMERRSERDSLSRPPAATAPGPNRDPVDGGLLLETPSDPTLRR